MPPGFARAPPPRSGADKGAHSCVASLDMPARAPLRPFFSAPCMTSNTVATTRRASLCSMLARASQRSRSASARARSSNLETALAGGDTLDRDNRHRAHALGDSWPAERPQRPPAHQLQRRGRGHSQRHRGELRRTARDAARRPATTFVSETDTETIAHLIEEPAERRRDAVRGRYARRRSHSKARRRSSR